jgi:hypothetical protein
VTSAGETPEMLIVLAAQPGIPRGRFGFAGDLSHLGHTRCTPSQTLDKPGPEHCYPLDHADIDTTPTIYVRRLDRLWLCRGRKMEAAGIEPA